MDQRPPPQRPFSQDAFEVRFDWGVDGLHDTGSTAQTIVIVDVLSFSTSVDVATSRGATVLPFSGSAAAAEEHAAARRAVATHRARGEPGAVTLSPASLQTIRAGTRLVMPSANGSTLSVLAGRLGAVVLAGCLRNASAVAAAAKAAGPPIAIIAAGERRPDARGRMRVALEDMLGAGAIMTALGGMAVSPEARAAIATFDVARTALAETLLSCGSGRELAARGFVDDVVIAARHDISSTVPILTDGAYAAGATDA